MNRILRSLPLWLRVVFTPLCWTQNKRYSAVWDRELRLLLDEGYRFHLEQHPWTDETFRADIGPYTGVWIENHPYASFTIHDVRPSRRTILRAGDMIAMARSEMERERFRKAEALIESAMARSAR